MAGKNRLLAKILGNNDGLITPDSDLLAVASTKNIPAAVGTSVYSSIDDLPSTAPAGEKALITSTNTLYLYNNGWYKIALINNFNPQWVTQPAATYDLAINSTPTVITMLATDSDDVPIRYIATTDSGFNSIATVSHDSDKHNVFTIIPTDSENGAATGGTGTITFKATDGVNQVQQVSTFSLTFGPDWTVSPTETIVRASDAQTGDGLGAASISKDNNYLITGASGEDGGAGDVLTGSGAAYVYTRSGTTWTEQTILRPSDKAATDGFGWFVDINNDGTYAVISSVAEDSYTGSAYVFTRSGSTWTQQAKLTAEANASTGANFGYEVSINGDGSYIIIGAQTENSNGGAVYIFARSGTTWTRQHREAAAGTNKRLGFSVSMSESGTYAASSQILGGTGGEAYVLTRSGSTWTMGSAIVGSDTAAGDQFGVSVAIEDDYLVAGSRNDDDGGTSSGSAYVFTRSGSTWSQQAKLVASDGEASTQLGESVAMSQDTKYVAIGAPDRNENSVTDPGAIYIFERDGSTWTQRAKLLSSTPGASDKLGEEVSIGGNGSFVVGIAPGDDGSGNTINQSGAAYVYSA